MEPRPYYLAGQWQHSTRTLSVPDPWTQQDAGVVCLADADALEKAVVAAVRAQEETQRLPAWKRHEICMEVAAGITSRREELAALICAEAGKPLQYARAEVDRAALTFSLAADLVRQSKGEILPLDLTPRTEGRMGLVRQVPLGPVLAISPFNFPLNLVAHKVAPALAVGNPVILKPASKTPLTALVLAEIIAGTGWPKEAFSVLPCPGSLAQRLVEDDRLRMLSFTGSPEVGWRLKAAAGRKKVALELGGDAAALVDSSADLGAAARACAAGAFAYAGQICISVQRILVHSQVYDAFGAAFLEAVQGLRSGDPRLGDVQVGPLIDGENRDRILHWAQEAVDAGAGLLHGSLSAEGNLVRPIVLEHPAAHTQVAQYEAFGPLVYLQRVQDMQAGFAAVNASRYGLQAGIFTDSQTVLKAAWESLEVGGIVVNDAPTLRVDNMPYGGVKESGFGREGLSWAMHEMTEPRLLLW